MINIKELAQKLDSKAKTYDDVFVATRDVISGINEISTKCELTLSDTYPNIEVTVVPFNIVIQVSPSYVKSEMVLRSLDIKTIIMGIISNHINKL